MPAVFDFPDDDEVEMRIDGRKYTTNTYDDSTNYLYVKYFFGISVRPLVRYKCLMCGKKYWLELKYHDHVNRLNHYLYRCNACNIGFNCEKSFREHLKKVHDVSQFTCSTCNKGFDSDGDFDEHVSVHKEFITFNCSMCPKKFLLKCRLRQHMHQRHCNSLSEPPTKKAKMYDVRSVTGRDENYFCDNEDNKNVLSEVSASSMELIVKRRKWLKKIQKQRIKKPFFPDDSSESDESVNDQCKKCDIDFDSRKNLYRYDIEELERDNIAPDTQESLHQQCFEENDENQINKSLNEQCFDENQANESLNQQCFEENDGNQANENLNQHCFEENDGNQANKSLNQRCFEKNDGNQANKSLRQQCFEEGDGNQTNHSSPRRKMYQCTVCTEKFSSKVMCMKHTATHMKLYSCDICPETFHNENDLGSHYRCHGSPMKVFTTTRSGRRVVKPKKYNLFDTDELEHKQPKESLNTKITDELQHKQPKESCSKRSKESCSKSVKVTKARNSLAVSIKTENLDTKISNNKELNIRPCVTYSKSPSNCAESVSTASNLKSSHRKVRNVSQELFSNDFKSNHSEFLQSELENHVQPSYIGESSHICIKPCSVNLRQEFKKEKEPCIVKLTVDSPNEQVRVKTPKTLNKAANRVSNLIAKPSDSNRKNQQPPDINTNNKVSDASPFSIPQFGQDFMFVGSRPDMDEIRRAIKELKSKKEMAKQENSDFKPSRAITDTESDDDSDDSDTSSDSEDSDLLVKASAPIAQEKAPVLPNIVPEKDILERIIIDNFVCIKVTPECMQKMQRQALELSESSEIAPPKVVEVKSIAGDIASHSEYVGDVDKITACSQDEKLLKLPDPYCTYLTNDTFSIGCPCNSKDCIDSFARLQYTNQPSPPRYPVNCAAAQFRL